MSLRIERLKPSSPVSSWVSSNRNFITTAGLTLYLDAGNSASYPGSGTTWTDISGNSRNFSLQNTSFDSSKGGSVVFNGSNALATISQTQSAIFRRTDAITYEAFIYKTSGGSLNLAGTNVSGGQGTGGISISNTGMTFFWTPSNPLSDRLFSANFSEDKTNKWFHFAICINYSTGSYEFYENGQLRVATPSGSWTTMSPSTSYNRSDLDSIGGRYVNSWGYWSGRIAVFRMYGAALSGQSVLQNFNAERNRFGI